MKMLLGCFRWGCIGITLFIVLIVAAHVRIGLYSRNSAREVYDALEKYCADHGNFPDSLQELVGTYTARIPEGVMAYRKSGQDNYFFMVCQDGVILFPIEDCYNRPDLMATFENKRSYGEYYCGEKHGVWTTMDQGRSIQKRYLCGFLEDDLNRRIGKAREVLASHSDWIKMVDIDVDRIGSLPAEVSPFQFSATEVPQKVYSLFFPDHRSIVRGDDLPVEGVSVVEAMVFCHCLNMTMGLPDAYDMKTMEINGVKGGFRLPTTDEWLLACLSGKRDGFYWGDTVDDAFLWYEGNATEPHRVGTKKPNSRGLYDLFGNVGEWCLGPTNRSAYNNSAVAGGDFTTNVERMRTCPIEGIDGSSGTNHGIRLARDIGGQ